MILNTRDVFYKAVCMCSPTNMESIHAYQVIYREWIPGFEKKFTDKTGFKCT